MASICQPQVGDTVRVYDHALNRHVSGTVVDLLNIQFTYAPAYPHQNGWLRYAKYNDQWEVIEPHEL
jgi:hypothetical protein